MLIRTICSTMFFVLIGLSVSACSTTGQGNSGGGGMTHSSPAGGGTSGGGMGGGY